METTNVDMSDPFVYCFHSWYLMSVFLTVPTIVKGGTSPSGKMVLDLVLPVRRGNLRTSRWGRRGYWYQQISSVTCYILFCFHQSNFGHIFRVFKWYYSFILTANNIPLGGCSCEKAHIAYGVIIAILVLIIIALLVFICRRERGKHSLKGMLSGNRIVGPTTILPVTIISTVNVVVVVLDCINSKNYIKEVKVQGRALCAVLSWEEELVQRLTYIDLLQLFMNSRNRNCLCLK